MANQVEELFMEWTLRDNMSPGALINELDLARRFGVAATSIREFLKFFHRFGLIEKRPNAGWVFKGFTASFALELFEIREMFELRSAKAFSALPAASPLGGASDAAHGARDVVDRIDGRYHDFPTSTAGFIALSIRLRPIGSSMVFTTSSPSSSTTTINGTSGTSGSATRSQSWSTSATSMRYWDAVSRWLKRRAGPTSPRQSKPSFELPQDMSRFAEAETAAGGCRRAGLKETRARRVDPEPSPRSTADRFAFAAAPNSRPPRRTSARRRRTPPQRTDPQPVQTCSVLRYPV